MNTNKNWTRVTVFVVLALTSLSSVALSAPRPAALAELCGASDPTYFEQYAAAIKWAEQGGPTPLALSVSCEDGRLSPSASLAGYGGESWARFEQYMAAIEGTTQVVTTAPVRTVGGSQARFEQYMAAIEWAERGGPVPQALQGGGVISPGDSRPFAGYGGESWARFEQYLAAIEQ